MAFKITKIEAKALAEHRIELARLRERIEDEFRALSAELRVIALPLNGLISEYNTALDWTKGFVDGVAEEHRDAYDEKSERWQEGDRGQAPEAGVRVVERVYTDIDGGRRLAEPVDGFVSWNVADIRRARRNER